MAKEKRYRWKCPGDWLLSKLDGEDADPEIILAAAQAFANGDPDAIQDLFQPDMDKDGYFRPL